MTHDVHQRVAPLPLHCTRAQRFYEALLDVQTRHEAIAASVRPAQPSASGDVDAATPVASHATQTAARD